MRLTSSSGAGRRPIEAGAMTAFSLFKKGKLSPATGLLPRCTRRGRTLPADSLIENGRLVDKDIPIDGDIPVGAGNPRN